MSPGAARRARLSLVEVVGLGPTTFGKGELVTTLSSRCTNVHVYHKHNATEGKKNLRKVKQEVEKGDQGEETAHHGWPWRRHERLKLEPKCMCA